MKPKDLKFPYSWEMRKPLLQEGIFYIPKYYNQHHQFHFPSWDQKELFGNHHPVHIEYCSGNGEWIIKKALSFPHLNWVAVEKKFDRVRKIASKRFNQKLSNLLIVCGDALTLTQEYLKEGCLDEVYVHFPDPWPKERHAKHRLIQKTFILELKQKMKERGYATFVTDSLPYHMQMKDVFSEVEGFHLHKNLRSSHEKKDVGDSFFYRLWRFLGREIYYLSYQRC